MLEVRIDSIAINTFHLSNKIETHLKQKKENIYISKETELLGTGGAISQIKTWLSHHDLLMINSDIFFTQDIKEFINYHYQNSCYITLALREKPHKNETPIWCIDNKVIQIGENKPNEKATAKGFACMQLLSNTFIKNMTTKTPSSIIDHYKAALMRGENITAYTLPKGLWHDLGTIESYCLAHIDYHLIKHGTINKESILNDIFQSKAYEQNKLMLAHKSSIIRTLESKY